MSAEVEIAVEVRRETDKALLVFDGKQEVWVPKSMITDQSEDERGNVETIFLPEWLALEKGLI